MKHIPLPNANQHDQKQENLQVKFQNSMERMFGRVSFVGTRHRLAWSLQRDVLKKGIVGLILLWHSIIDILYRFCAYLIIPVSKRLASSIFVPMQRNPPKRKSNGPEPEKTYVSQ